MCTFREIPHTPMSAAEICFMTATELTGELVCYARSVAGPEWDALASGELHEGANRWGAELFRTLRTIDPETPAEQAAYAKWLDQTSDREAARQDRVHGAPAFGRHRRRSVPGVRVARRGAHASSSRRSHMRATAHSRPTVAVEMPSTSAASGMLSPAK